MYHATSLLHSDKKTWDQAQGMCQDMGGYLATLDSWDEIYWLKGYRSSHPSLRPERMHIGGRKIDGVWYWVHKLAKTPITGFDWAEGEPREDTNSGVCINLAGDTGYWEKIPKSWFTLIIFGVRIRCHTYVNMTLLLPNKACTSLITAQ